MIDWWLSSCRYLAVHRQQYSYSRCWDDWLIVSEFEGCRNPAVGLLGWLIVYKLVVGTRQWEGNRTAAAGDEHDWLIVSDCVGCLQDPSSGLGGWLTDCLHTCCWYPAMLRQQDSCSRWWDDWLIVSECEGCRSPAMGLGGWLTDCLLTYCWYPAMLRQQYSCSWWWDDWLIVTECEGCRNPAKNLGGWLTDCFLTFGTRQCPGNSTPVADGAMIDWLYLNVRTAVPGSGFGRMIDWLFTYLLLVPSNAQATVLLH